MSVGQKASKQINWLPYSQKYCTKTTALALGKKIDLLLIIDTFNRREPVKKMKKEKMVK